MKMNQLATARQTIRRMCQLDPQVPMLQIARMRLAEKGTLNHWTLTYRRNADAIFEFRNPSKPGLSPVCSL